MASLEEFSAAVKNKCGCGDRRAVFALPTANAHIFSGGHYKSVRLQVVGKKQVLT